MSTRYHRLARQTPAYAWWKLPVAGVLAVVLYLAAMVALVLVALAVFAATSRAERLDTWLDSVGDLDLTRLDFFALDMVSVALMLPAVLVAVLVTGPRPIGYLSSVTGRLRWRWLGRTMLMSFTVFIVTIGASLAVAAWTDPGEVQAPGHADTQLILAIALVLAITPFQAAAEEYVFRGYVLQLVGSWTRFATVPVLVSVPLFAAGHDYHLWGLLDVGLFGLTAAVLVIRTGGLEAAIAAHTANNVVLLTLDALGMISATDDSSAGPLDLLPTIASSILLLAWVEWSARRHHIVRTRDPIPDPPPAPWPMWPPAPYLYAWWAQPAQPPPPPAPPRPPLHPNTPDYPGELPWGWR